MKNIIIFSDKENFVKLSVSTNKVSFIGKAAPFSWVWKTFILEESQHWLDHRDGHNISCVWVTGVICLGLTWHITLVLVNWWPAPSQRCNNSPVRRGWPAVRPASPSQSQAGARLGPTIAHRDNTGLDWQNIEREITLRLELDRNFENIRVLLLNHL